MENFEKIIEKHCATDIQFRKEIERHKFYGYYCEKKRVAYQLWSKGLPIRMAFGFSH